MVHWFSIQVSYTTLLYNPKKHGRKFHYFFILRFLNSCPTSEATITRFFTAHHIVLWKRCQIAFYHQVSYKSSQTNHPCSGLSVCVAFIKGRIESQERIPRPWIIAQSYFRSLTENLFSTSPFFRHALVGLCESSSLDSHVLTITRTPGVLLWHQLQRTQRPNIYL